MKSQLVVDDVKVVKNKLSVHYHCYGDIANFVEGNPFIAEYNCDIEHIPEGLLIIPFLANVYPVAWVTDSTIYCQQVDLQFYQSLDGIRDTFRSLYPELWWTGKLNANHITNHRMVFPEKSRAALFYSGGVHSSASYTQIRHEQPILITITNQELDQVNQENSATFVGEVMNFADKRELEVGLIHSNFKEIIKYQTINLVYGRSLDSDWWNDIQKGLGMIGLAAPLTFHYQLSKLYVGADHPPKSLFTQSSAHPEIDHQIKWGSDSFQVFDQGYVLTRYEKIALICDHIKKYDSDLKLSVCSYDGRTNCSECEKCTRTILSMLIQGINPAKHGFQKVDRTVLDKIKEGMEQGQIVTPLLMEEYQEIQKHVAVNKQEIPGVALDFFNWYEKVNLASIHRKKHARETWLRIKKRTKNRVKQSPLIEKVNQRLNR